MNSPSKSHLIFFSVLLLLFLHPISSLSGASDERPTAYQMLEKFDLPRGILPEGAQSYVLRPDGSFEVYLAGDCEFKVSGSYLLRYEKKVSGTVSAGSLTGLRGVSVKVLFLWFGVSEVARSGDDLVFCVGPLSATFAMANFKVCPSCRCGFHCSAADWASDA